MKKYSPTSAADVLVAAIFAAAVAARRSGRRQPPKSSVCTRPAAEYSIEIDDNDTVAGATIRFSTGRKRGHG